MTKRLFSENLGFKGQGGFSGFTLCVAFFISGAFIGSFAAGLIDNGSGLSDYISAYISLAKSGSAAAPDFLTVLWSGSKYHLAAVCLGFCVLGVAGIPVLLGVKGFFLSFSTAVFIRIMGQNGLLLAFGIFGLTAVFTLPCLFILATQAFSSSYLLLGIASNRGIKSSSPIYDMGYFTRCGICALVLLVSAVIETFLTPLIVTFISTLV